MSRSQKRAKWIAIRLSCTAADLLCALPFGLTFSPARWFFLGVASKVADEIWQAVSKGQDEVVIADLKTNVAVLLRALAPRVLFRIMAKRALKAKEGAQ